MLAESAGFCFGVKRAMQMAYQTLEEAGKENKGKVYSLGPIVHNPQVVAKLEEMGISVIHDLDMADSGYMIVRTHGIAPEKREEILKRGFKIIDATCPLVRKIHNIVQKFEKNGYRIVVIGHKDHPEVKGILGHSTTKAHVVENAEELKEIPGKEKIGVVVQTTESLENFRRISLALSEMYDCSISNTICYATGERQKAASELAKVVDIMVVVGGKNSSNTARLVEICKETGTVTYHVETAKELKKSWFKGVKKVGITAGASTPDWIIQEVIQWLEKLDSGRNKTGNTR